MKAALLLLPALLCTAAVAGVDIVEETPAGPGRTFVARTVIGASPEKLCRIVQDYASYGAFMPDTRSAVLVAAGPGYALVDMTLDLPLGQMKQYRLRLEPSVMAGGCRLAWRQVPRPDLRPEQTIADTSGYWEFTQVESDSPAALVRYRVHADPGHVPFGFGWIVEMMSRRSLPRTLEALRQRATVVD